MLDYKIINYKKLIQKNSHSEQYIDLLSKSFNKDLIPMGGLYIVTKEYVARPDLISQAYYQDDRYADIICKVNGISNPFELNENDVLLIPSLEYITSCAKNYDFSGSELADDADELQKKVNSFQKPKNSKRTSNEQVEGESSYYIDKSMGVVFY